MIATRTHSPESEVESWPTVTDQSEAAWEQVMEAFRSSSEALVEAAGRLTDEDLKAPLAGASFPLKVAVHGVAHHSLYHAAQIAMLRKALG